MEWTKPQLLCSDRKNVQHIYITRQQNKTNLNQKKSLEKARDYQRKKILQAAIQRVCNVCNVCFDEYEFKQKTVSTNINLLSHFLK